ncbi:hypothetical protein FH972_017647 [Carpinus fangiana]|uniref:Alpha-carbonic anhydrase domain-containing protein n=1 Tax=Carpinus fangiana TaxID=176857 RepID=A0A5N6RNH0_9ROSI|nr:hypothetical protein FH972_017647 [Carpinus fangiana]
MKNIMKNPSAPAAAFISSFLIFLVLFSCLTSTASQEVGIYIYIYTHTCTLFFVFVFVFFLLLTCESCGAENEREFDYAEGSEKGPLQWGEIHEEWAACKNGSMQSPIDMSSERVKMIPKLGKLKRNYRYELELHMVHETSNPGVKKIAVVGLLYKIGPPDAFLSKLMRNVNSMIDKKDERKMGMIDPAEIKMGGRKYYRYIGSLTIPPCTEGVIWTINKKIRTVSREQVKLLREAVHDYAERNARPVQPLNHREIQLYGPNP